LKKKPPRYEKPVLEFLRVVGQGQLSPACINGSAVDGSCSPNGAFAGTTCDTGSSPHPV